MDNYFGSGLGVVPQRTPQPTRHAVTGTQKIADSYHTYGSSWNLDALSPSHARTQLAIRGVYIFCMGGPTSASRRCRAPRTNSPCEWGRSRADPEEAVMIKAVIPD